MIGKEEERNNCSPVIHLKCCDELSREEAESYLASIVRKVKQKHQILISLSVCLDLEWEKGHEPTIEIDITVKHGKEHFDLLRDALIDVTNNN